MNKKTCKHFQADFAIIYLVSRRMWRDEKLQNKELKLKQMTPLTVLLLGFCPQSCGEQSHV